MANQPLQKRYYTIGEVAEMFQVSKSLIRFWENEFDFLRPHKNSKGDRRFTPKNIEQFALIHTLVKDRGFTLDGAKQELKRKQQFEKERSKMLASLRDLRTFLIEMREDLEGA